MLRTAVLCDCRRSGHLRCGAGVRGPRRLGGGGAGLVGRQAEETSDPEFKDLEHGRAERMQAEDRRLGWVPPSGWVVPYRAIVLLDGGWLAAGSPSCTKNTLTTSPHPMH